MKNKYWFKRRRYGLGWTPSSKEGWFVIVIFILLVILSSNIIKGINENEISINLISYFVVIFSLIVALISISYIKGPKPKWRWGRKDDDDPELDY